MPKILKRKVLHILYKIGITKDIARTRLDARVEKHASKDRTLDVGGGGGGYAKYFPNRVSVDIVQNENVDVVADVHELSKHFTKEEFSVVLCTEALEHFYHPHKAIEEMAYVLKGGGILILSTRFIFPLHETPHDYFRFTEYGLRHLLRDFEILEFKQDGNTMEALAVLYQRIGHQCDTLWFKPFKLFWLLAARVMGVFTWVLTKEYGDVNHKNTVASIMTSGYFVVAKKKPIKANTK